jgi:hypothetical protein
MRKETAGGAESSDHEHGCERCGVCRLRIGPGGCVRRRTAADENSLWAEVVVGEMAETVVPLRRSV